MDEIPVGISTCLLGQPVRYNAGHKRDPYLVDTLGPFVSWVPVCPEVELGMGTPREPVRLVMRDGKPHMVGVTSGDDWTDQMNAFARRRVTRLPALCGYVFKSDSPSCGAFRVKLYSDRPGPPARKGVGLFVAELRAQRPLLPIEEEGRLHDPKLREGFIERVFGYDRLRQLLAGRFSVGRLVAFHAAHKYQILAHSTEAYRQLGQLVASAKGRDAGSVKQTYAERFMRALELEATAPKHANVLQHILGHFKRQLDADEKQEVLEAIEAFRAGLAPLIVPVTLLRHFVRKYGEPWLSTQTYLSPYPKELMLRNHA